MNDLQERVKTEHIPREKNEQDLENCQNWPVEEWFQHYACLYIDYIQVYKKLEECYDQIVHPQKRMCIKPVLETTITRICEIKKDLVTFNPRPGSIYVHLDQILFDIKMDPSMIEIPIPRYFKEDDPIELDLKWKEAIERAAKKKKKKKSKKKKKKKGEGDAPKPPRITLDQKRKLLDGLLESTVKTTEPEQEIVHDPFTLDMDIISAIRLIQKNDRGRQYRDRLKIADKAYQTNATGGGGTKFGGRAPAISEGEATKKIQKILRGILARKRVDMMR